MKKITTGIVLPDVHLDEGVNKIYKVVKSFIATVEPDIIIIAGDFMDCPSFSHWDMDKRQLMEGKRFAKECAVANRELDFLQRYSKKVVYIEGNHENWVVQYIQRNPEMEGLIELPLRLRLEERNIEWVPMNELYRIGNLYFTHGMYTNKYHAIQHLVRLGCNICYGHVHNAQTAQINMKMQEPYMAYGLGCLCDSAPHYMKGKPCNWINQFAQFYINNRNDNFALYPINIIGDEILWGGRVIK